MQKPITIIIEEFQHNLGAAVNDSGLPLFIVEPIVREFLENIQYGVRRQAEADRAEYSRYLQEQEEKSVEAATAPSSANKDRVCSAPENAKPSKSEG